VVDGRGERGHRRVTKDFERVDTVVLDRDLPEHGLKRGAPGAVVEVHAPDGLDVELVTASGRTQALVTLKTADVRAVADGDRIAGRPARAAG